MNLAPPLIENLIDLKMQVQPCGVDLTITQVAAPLSGGSIGFDNKNRILPETMLLSFDDNGWLKLNPGCYIITYNEVIHLPDNIMAIGLPRSSLLRCGVAIHTAVWDPGYSGRSQSLMVVFNQNGFRLQKDSRVMQIVFMRLGEKSEEGYSGVYQRENI